MRDFMNMKSSTFVESVDAFVESADWLTDEDMPAVVSLYKMAIALDDEITGPIMSAFGLTYRNLAKKKVVAEEESELDKLLTR